jgi:hypothetical protein
MEADPVACMIKAWSCFIIFINGIGPRFAWVIPGSGAAGNVPFPL